MSLSQAVNATQKQRTRPRNIQVGEQFRFHGRVGSGYLGMFRSRVRCFWVAFTACDNNTYYFSGIHRTYITIVTTIGASGAGSGAEYTGLLLLCSGVVLTASVRDIWGCFGVAFVVSGSRPSSVICQENAHLNQQMK